MSDEIDDIGPVYRQGDWYAHHEIPRDRPHEGATLHVWHKHGDSSLYVARDPDEIDALIALLQEARGFVVDKVTK